jgi:hypothetical protein
LDAWLNHADAVLSRRSHLDLFRLLSLLIFLQLQESLVLLSTKFH